MKRISNRTRHFFISCHGSNLSVSCHMPFRNLFHCFINPFCRIIRDKFITLINHFSNIRIRDGSIQNNRIPVFLVLMPSRYYGIIDTTPEISALRRYLYIQTEKSFPFISPQKNFFTFFHSYKLPVGISKRCVLICVREG